AGLREALFDEVAEHGRRNLLEPHDRSRLVERATWADHLVHQARLGPGEDISNLALMLCSGAKRVLDAAAVEAVDRLEFVERNDEGPFAIGRQLARQRKDLVGEAVQVAAGGNLRKRDGEAPQARILRLVANLRTRRRDGLHEPGARPIP